MYAEVLDQIRNKLSYEWKNVYRQLNSSDVADTGKINKKQLEDALRKTGVFLSNEDIRNIQEKFGDS